MLDLNLERLNAHRETIEANLQQLEGLRGRTFKEFTQDAQALAAAKYWLQSAIQAMIDITSHICARLRLATQPDSGECIRALEAKELLPKENATKYVQMIRFRNVLVHLYGEVDDKRVHEILEKELEYFRMFLIDLDAIVEQQEKQKKSKGKRKK